MAKKKLLFSIFIGTTLGLLLAFAGSQFGQTYKNIPVFFICVVLAFVINWLAFLPAFAKQTETFFDLVGSLTYITVTSTALVLCDNLDARSILLASLVIIWALRLGTFLFRRIHKAGKDDRFDSIKANFLRFFNTWTLQALWVTFTAAAALVSITSEQREAIGIFALIGSIVWLIGFSIEVIADNQKSKFKADKANQGKFINTGLWSRSRHPNYFGEIMLWIGIAIIALPVLQGWQWTALISPVFVTLLLTKVSGIPMLEQKADKKWGGQPDYEAYKENTPVLIPKLK